MWPIKALGRELHSIQGCDESHQYFKAQVRPLWRNVLKEQPESVLQVDALGKSPAAPQLIDFFMHPLGFRFAPSGRRPYALHPGLQSSYAFGLYPDNLIVPLIKGLRSG
jgi:hypothetical protein